MPDEFTTIEAFLESAFTDSGYFLEIGCWDGELISQTAYLERTKGWKGTCVDPFPRGFENRSCQLVTKAISADGQPREFIKVSIDRRYGGDVSYFSGFKNAISTHWPLIQEHCDYEEIIVETITFTQLGEQYGLPKHIDFLSVDTEGSEMEVFAGIDFETYSFGIIMFEHNENEHVREAIGQLLRSKGYRLIATPRIDDIYQRNGA